MCGGEVILTFDYDARRANDGLAPGEKAADLKTGAGDRNRTYDLRITNALLYRLSYTGVQDLKVYISAWKTKEVA